MTSFLTVVKGNKLKSELGLSLCKEFHCAVETLEKDRMPKVVVLEFGIVSKPILAPLVP